MYKNVVVGLRGGSEGPSTVRRYVATLCAVSLTATFSTAATADDGDPPTVEELRDPVEASGRHEREGDLMAPDTLWPSYPPRPVQRDYRFDTDKMWKSGIILAGVGGGLAVLGIAGTTYFGVKGERFGDMLADDKQWYEDNCRYGPTYPQSMCAQQQERIDVIRDNGRKANRLAYTYVAVTVTGLSALGVGIAFLAIANKRRSAAKLTLAPTLNGLLLSGRF